MPLNRPRQILLAVLSCLVALAISATSASAQFGLQPGSFEVTTTDNEGQPLAQAGAHSNLTTTLKLNRTLDANGFDVPDGDLRDVRLQLPPGAVGDPSATPKCRPDQFNGATQDGFASCPPETQVGTIELGIQNHYNDPFEIFPVLLPINNIQQEAGKPALFGFEFLRVKVLINVHVRTESDYGVTAVIRDIPAGLLVGSSTTTFWGVPLDSSHDPDRLPPGPAGSALVTPRALMSNPTSCGATPAVKVEVRSWQEPDRWVTAEDPQPPTTGCGRLQFKPSISVQPTSNQADSPSGLAIDLHIPQSSDPNGLATAHLKRAELSFPAGMSVNPSSADGLGSCSEAQIALGTDRPAACPDSAKVGTVEVETPVLETPLKGSVYLAAQGTNPFKSLLALYVVAEGEGVVVKLPGQLSADPVTGQLKAVVDNSPQLPFEDLHMVIKSGSRASLITPPVCGTYSTQASFSSWAQPNNPLATSDSFTISSGPNGGPCPSPGQFDPSFEVGTVTPIAGAYSPLVVKASRPDGSQVLKGLTVNLPPGLVGKLAGIPYCPNSALASAEGKSGAQEQASPSCPAASRVGSVDVGAGAGSTPFHATGTVYLTGPYKGAPLSLAVVTPAVAGPFDLGTVVVRNALRVDPVTAEITAVSDPIPTILQGIPLKIRSVFVNADRPEFALNPTSCDAMSVTGALVGTSAAKGVSNRFQVGACNALGFKPSLALKLSGPTHRSAYPALRATLTMPKGGANIQRAAVTLPKTEILEQAHIKTICTRVQYAAKACPKASVYGYAKAWSPLLDKPLQGPVYLRSSSHKLPDLVASLDGQIHIDLQGRIDSTKARIRNTFDLVPDAPVSKFVLTMQGGKKGLLVNNTELCRARPRADALFDAQNGKVSDTQPLAKVDCGKGDKGGRK